MFYIGVEKGKEHFKVELSSMCFFSCGINGNKIFPQGNKSYKSKANDQSPLLFSCYVSGVFPGADKSLTVVI